MNICLFTSDEISRPLSLRDARAEHLIKILHKKAGDTFRAGIIGGAAGTATITRIDEHDEKSADGKKSFSSGSIEFTFRAESDGRPLFPLVMIVGFPRPIQLRRLLRDMAGLGVCEIHLTGTELGEKSYLKSDMASGSAGYEMLLEGTEQAGGTMVPALFKHESLAACLDFVEKRLSGKKVLRAALDNKSPTESLVRFLGGRAPSDFTVAAVGSERGWTDAERRLLSKRGFTLLGMGERILRTETACTVAASLILAREGALG